ncbi:uncharacterized protein LOC141651354 [Silene latifolia]|uniref:uncharacterized protein LOC141651354 n=1 Tax=Silene latifolia TaxID=37657 RepID=UPI003D776F39
MPESIPTSDQTSDQYSPFDDPLFLTRNDQPNLKLTDVLFDGTNFLQWQRDVVQALLSKNKSGFITGECSMPEKNDKTYNQWIRCDLLDLRWILHSIVPSLRENLQYAASAKNLWSEIVERYGQLNVLELYELKKDLINAKEDNIPLIEYYSRMKNLWESIDQMDPVPMCVCGVMSKCTCQLLKRILDRETHAKLI